MIRHIAFVALLTVSACGGRGVFTPTPDTTGDVQPIYLVTNRVAEPPWRYETAPAETITHVRYGVSLPEGRNTADLDFDASGSMAFGISSAETIPSRAAFIASLDHAGPSDAPVAVFVHGYNYNVPEAVYRQAQMAADFESPGPQITFAWPSLGQAVGYVADRDSSMASRDALEGLLVDLAKKQDRPIILIAHSMGAQLLMETLRQMAIGGRGINNRIGGVFLISPDIDIEVFRTQAARIGRLPRPFVVAISENDQALRASAQLSGQTPRLGSPKDLTLLRNLDITVVDLSDVKGGDAAGHFSAATSPAAISFLRSIAENGELFEPRKQISFNILRPRQLSIAQGG